jgi:hypothetical protein
VGKKKKRKKNISQRDMVGLIIELATFGKRK